MKIVGYFLKGLSLFFFVVITLSVSSTLLQIGEYKKEGTSFIMGYLFGVVFVVAILGWMTYKLFQYSNRLIKENK